LIYTFQSPMDRLLLRRRAPTQQATRLPVPVLTLDGDQVAAWASLVTGTGTTPTSGFLLTSTPEASTPLPDEDEQAIDSLSPEQLVDDFREYASPAAFRLAQFLAAAPLSLPVIRLVQRTMMPKARQGHIAEVFLSGLLRRRTPAKDKVHPEYVWYDFLTGVREVLRQGLSLYEDALVMERVTEYVREHYGTPQDFQALLFDPDAVDGVALHSDLLPFAEVVAGLQERVGIQTNTSAFGKSESSSVKIVVDEPEMASTSEARATSTSFSFHSRGALSPTNPLFRGRKEELTRLMGLCQQDVSAYVIVYSGRQTGKTSLLLQLERELQGTPARVCRVDFQGVPGADAARMYRFLAQRIAASLPLTPNSDAVSDPPSLVRFLTQALSTSDVPRLVVLMDELGALPEQTRGELGNVLRSLFHERLINPALAKLQIVLTGGIELHTLMVAEVSPLRNICEEIYLGDLDEAEAVALIADGLEPLMIAREEGEQIGRAVYSWAEGHPYLTQRLGQLLSVSYRDGKPLDARHLNESVIMVLRHDVLLQHLHIKLFEYRLQDIAHQLLTAPPRFSRVYGDMVQMELLGLAKGVNGQWAVRNPLIETALRDWLGMVPMTPLQVPPIPAPTPESQPAPEPRGQPPVPQPAQPKAPMVIDIAPGVTMEFVEIPAGPFLMGSSDNDPYAYDNEKPQHQLQLPGYWISKTQVTNAQFRPFVEDDGYTNRAYWTEAGWEWREKQRIYAPRWWNDEQVNGNEQPVVGIAWYVAVAYCNWLTAQTGIDFRLPTEAEWEKAARGTDGRFWPWGNTWQEGRCNSKAVGIGRPTPVEQYPTGASCYGIFDMAGNVWEWCATSWRKDYPYQLEDEWTTSYLIGDDARVIRGGSWYDESSDVRGARRNYFLARDSNPNIGFRVVVTNL
jgi:formylglycine-generating enzyme required for sulfatase activity